MPRFDFVACLLLQGASGFILPAKRPFARKTLQVFGVEEEGPIDVDAYVFPSQGAKAELQKITLPPLKSTEVEVDMKYNGLCHTEIHMRDNDWGISNYPMVAGHEGIGTVRRIGSDVKTHKVGDVVGVTWVRDSCRVCDACLCGRENICRTGYQGLYLGSNAGPWGKEGNFNEHGGCFSKVVRVGAHFAVKIPEGLPAEVACPLMCGGGTVFESLTDYASVGTKVGVIGIGGLGTSAIRLAKIKGASVTAISRSPKKEKGCYDEGVNDFLLSTDEAKMAEYQGKFDLLLDCTPVNTDLKPWMELLKFDGTYCRVGIPSADDAEFKYDFITAITQQKKISGSIIIGTARMNLLLDIVAANQDLFKNTDETFTQIIPFSKVNEAMDALQQNKVECYRTILAWDA